MRRSFRLPWRTPKQIRDEVDEELAFHIDMRAAELAATGLTPERARDEAMRQFGDLEYTREYCRAVDAGREAHVRRADRLDELRQDVRFAWRTLWKRPTFALVAIATIALGIGANTAIFSVVYGVLLRPLPYREPERLVRLFAAHERERIPISPRELEDWRAQTHAFDAIAAFTQSSVTLTGDGADAERVDAARVSANLFTLLGVRPIAGRGFTPRRDIDTPPPEVVLSEGLWRRRFGADPRVVGRSITIDGLRFTVVGVVPRGREYPVGAEIWGAYYTPPELLAERTRGARFLRVLARLAPAATMEQASTEMATVASRLAAQFPGENTGLTAIVVPLRDYLVSNVRRPLFVLLGAVGFVLLIACANVANLLLVRAAGRTEELAIRSAIGAGRWRLVRQLVTESVLLALLGGAAAVALARWGTGRLVLLAHDQLPRSGEVRVDGTVLLVTLAVAIATGVLFGILPAAHASSPELAQALRDGKRAATTRTGRHVRGALVVSELALSVMLLAGAGLLLESFGRLRQVDPGFDAERAVTFKVDLPGAKYPPERRRVFVDALLQRLRALPSVQSVATSSALPLSGASFILPFQVENRAAPEPGHQPASEVRVVSAGYFATMRIPLVRGRAIDEHDLAGAAPVMVINESLARLYFPGEDPIGKRLRYAYAMPLAGEIVGVVKDVKQISLSGETGAEGYLSADQYPFGDLAVVVRATAAPSAIITASRALVRALDPDVPVDDARTLDDLVAQSVAQPRFYTTLLTAFALLALVLAAVGVYGVISYSVSQRSHEIGIRMALGATPSDVLRLVVGEGLRLTALGLALGIAGALWATRLMTDLLFGVSPTDPKPFLGGSLILAAVALGACHFPARRAARVDPTVALHGGR